MRSKFKSLIDASKLTTTGTDMVRTQNEKCRLYKKDAGHNNCGQTGPINEKELTSSLGENCKQSPPKQQRLRNLTKPIVAIY